MDKYPPYMLQEPKPLVFVQGSVENEPDFLNKLVGMLDSTSVEMTDVKDAVNLEFRAVAMDHDYLPKKAKGDQIHLDGVLRDNWLQKHKALLPSVIVLVTTFSIEWNTPDWMRREAALFDRYTRIKNAVAGRDVKIVLLPMRIGTAPQNYDKDGIEERISSLKRHFQMDTKLFMMMTSAEVTAGSTTVRRLVKTVRDLSTAYYGSQAKRARSIEKGSNVKGNFEHIVASRYSFKVGYFNEFLGQRAQSLKYYRLSFQALAAAAEVIEEDLIDQVKMLADYANFKICSIYLRSGAVREATMQFKSLIVHFGKVYCDMVWRHQAWLSDQYIAYAQLLEMHGCTDPFVETDRAYFFQNAARYAAKRQASFSRIRNATQGAWEARNSLSAGSIDNGTAARFASMIAVPPRYLGAMPTLIDPLLGQTPQLQTEDMARFIRTQIEDKERFVNHGAAVMKLLQQCLDCIDNTQWRRRAFVRCLMADQHMVQGQYQEAFEKYTQVAAGLCKEGWVNCIVPILRKKLTCALYLGRSTQYMLSAINLFALAATDHLSKYEKEDLHRDMMAIAMSSAVDSSGITSATSFFGKPEFASFAVDPASVEYCLPNNYMIELSETNYSKMFDVKVEFDRKSVELGHYVRVNMFVTSFFAGNMTFSEMSVCFSGDALIRRFVHDGSGSGDSVGGICENEEDLLMSSSSSFPNDILKKDRRPSLSGLVASNNSAPTKASLVFAAKKPVSFSFLIFVPENSFSASSLSSEPCIFVDKVLFTLATPSSTTVNQLQVNTSQDNDNVTADSGDVVASIDSTAAALISNLAISESSSSKHIIFLVSTVTKAFLAKRESFGKGISLKDVCQFLPPKDCPSLLQIERLGALLDLVYPARVPLPAGTAPTSSSTSTNSIFAPPAAVQANPTQPGTIQLLQGPVQRINLIFKTNGNSVINGKLYLSSDFPTAVVAAGGTNQHLFWYPDISAIDEADMKIPEKVDAVKFHPFKLSSSMQPSQPILIPTQIGSDSEFCVPIFVKSELHTTITVKLLVEYVPKRRLTTSVTKDFEFKISFLKPLQMSFVLASWKDNQCGIVRDASVSTVLAGDTIAMSATLSCATALNGSLDLLGMNLQRSEAAGENNQGRPFTFLDASNPNKFNFIPAEPMVDIPAELQSNLNERVNMRIGEVFVCAVDIACNKTATDTALTAITSPDQIMRTGSNLSDPSNSSHAIIGSRNIGNLFVAWRFVDANFMQPAALESLGAIKSSSSCSGNVGARLSIEQSITRDGSCDSVEDAEATDKALELLANRNGNNNGLGKGKSTKPVVFEWLHRLLPPVRASDETGSVSSGSGSVSSGSGSGSGGQLSLAALDVTITATRVCEMIFSVPAVMVVDAPFEVNIDSPPVCNVGEFQSMHLIIKSKLWSLERFVVQLLLHENLIVTGPTSCTIEVGPCGTATLSLGFAALKCGPVALPQVSVIWERNGAPILDLGMQVGRQVFVYP